MKKEEARTKDSTQVRRLKALARSNMEIYPEMAAELLKKKEKEKEKEKETKAHRERL